MSRRSTIAIIAALVVVAAVAVGAATSSGTSKAPTVKTRSTSLGTILVDAKGHTLYLFEKDHGGTSACAGACANEWPPLIAKGGVSAGGSARSSKLGTSRRSDGRRQVTYGGHPLYTFVADNGRPGSTKGEGVDAFGAKWFVVGPAGTKIAKGQNSSSGPSGYGGY